MKTFKRNLILLVLLSGTVITFSQCTKESVNDGAQNQSDLKSISQGIPSTIDNGGTSNSNSGISATGYLCSCISTLPIEPLSTTEIDALNTMREEELLAHDVYVLFYSLYKIPIFNNISKAETQHGEALKGLLLKYSLPDPAVNHVAGIFVNPVLQTLYKNLVAQGNVSLNAGLTIGATIEDMDINDLHNHIATDVDNKDILFVFGNLEKGSRNHLRSFLVS